MDLLPETISGIKQLYSEKKQAIEYKILHGNKFERAWNVLIRDIAVGAPRVTCLNIDADAMV
jgi:hypothetical protein